MSVPPAAVALYAQSSGTPYALQCDANGNLVVQPAYAWLNAKAAGAKADGTTDNCTVITSLANSCSSAGGGTIYFPGASGAYRTSCTLVLPSGCALMGDGITASVLKLTDNANVDVVQSAAQGYAAGVVTNPWASSGTGAQTGNYGNAIINLAIDGDISNQSGAGPYYGLNYYGYGLVLQNAVITNVKGDCLRLDYNYSTAFYSFPSQGRNDRADTVTTSYCGGYYVGSTYTITSAGAVGVRDAGPTDNQFANVISFRNAGENFHQGPNSGGTQWSNVHGYGSPTSTAYPVPCALIESVFQAKNFECEGAGNSTVVNTPQVQIINAAGSSGDFFLYAPTASTNSQTPTGVQLGVAASTWGVIGSYYASSGQSASTTPVVPTSTSSVASPANRNNLSVTGNGLSGGIFNFISGEEANNYIFGFIDNTGYSGGLYYTGTIAGSDRLYVTGQGVTCLNSLATCGGSSGLYGSSWSFTPVHTGMWNSTGSISYTPASSQTATTSGTINVSVSSSNNYILPVTAAGNVTGVTLNTGTQNGQVVRLVDTSAFTIGLTTNIAGSGITIPATGQVECTWLTATSLWYCK